MIFEKDYYTLRDEFSKYLAYENDTDTYDILVFVDTGYDFGYLKRSDAICAFDDMTGSLVAYTERVNKHDLGFIDRLRLPFIKREVMRNTPIGFECFIQNRGDYLEFQFYRRWWYDLNIQFGAININKRIVTGGGGGKDKSDT